jgi:hypothetical protein
MIVYVHCTAVGDSDKFIFLKAVTYTKNLLYLPFRYELKTNENEYQLWK